MRRIKPIHYTTISLLLALLAPGFALAASAVVPSEAIVPSIERISWSAIFAGAVVALAAQIVFSMLGIGIGAAAIDPYDHKHPTKGIPTTMMLWMFCSGLVSLFIGGWVAGRLAGTVPFDSAIHGVVTWALAMVLMFLLATTSIGHLIGGTFRILGNGASAAAQAAASVVPEAAQMAKDAIATAVPQFDWKAIKREAKHLMQDTGKDSLKPDELANKGEELKNQAKKAVGQAVQNPEEAEEELSELLSKAYGMVRENLNPADRESLINVITSKTGVSKEEANKTVEKWEKMYREAKQKYQQAVEQAEKSARDVAYATKTAVSHIAVWSFFILTFGMAVAAIGGNLGSTYARL